MSEPRMCCRDCLYRQPDDRLEYSDAGQCRRYPPIVVEQVSFDGSGFNHFSQHWPWMAAFDWCGEWKSNRTITHQKLETGE
jgi:hypothetical protein